MINFKYLLIVYYLIIINKDVASNKIDIKKCCAFADRYNRMTKACVPNHKNFKIHADFGNFNLKSKMCVGELIQNHGKNKISEEYGNLVGVKNETDKIYFDFCVDADSENGQNVAILCNTERTIKKCCPAGTKIHRSGNIFDCKPTSDPVILEDIVNQVEEKPNIRILYSEHQVFFSSKNFTNFDQLDNSDCVDKFNRTWVIVNKFQRPLSPWTEIFNIIFIVLFILYMRINFFDFQLLNKFKDCSKNFRKKEIVEDGKAATSLDLLSNLKASTSQPQNNKSFSNGSLKIIIPIKLLLYYATLILVKLILSISFEIFQKPQFLFWHDILLVGSSCVFMSIWFEIVFRKRANKKSDTYYFSSIVLLTLAMALIFVHLTSKFDEIGEFDLRK